MNDVPEDHRPVGLAVRLSRREVGGLAAGALAALGLGAETEAWRRHKRRQRRHKRQQRQHKRRVGGQNGLGFQFVTQWGSHGSDAGQFDGPFGIAIDSRNNVYIVDADNNRVQKFSRTGVFQLAWGSPGQGNGHFAQPSAIAIDPDDFVYVSDVGTQRIQKFTSSGNFLLAWGAAGAGDGQFLQPEGLAADSASNIYVTDAQLNRVQKFSSTGAFLTKWGSFGRGPGQFGQPIGIAVDSASAVYVADAQRIEKFDSQGTFVTQWDAQTGIAYGLALDANRNVYVTDFGAHKVNVFTNSGAFVDTFGSNKNDDFELDQPSGIGIDSVGNVYVADTDNDRVKKFAPT